MAKHDLTKIAEQLAENLKGSLSKEFIEIKKLLINGTPVKHGEIASVLNIPVEDVPDLLKKIPDIELDKTGNVRGSGITLNPTHHNFYIKGHHLYTWCAFDTLFFPVILNETAIIESKCPASDVIVKLTVSPEKIESMEPGNAVISIIIPDESDACCNVRSAFCNKIFFFDSEKSAVQWIKDKDIIIMPVYNAFLLGQKFTKLLLDGHQ